MKYLRFSYWWLMFWVIKPCICWYSTNVSEGHSGSKFRAKEENKQETFSAQLASWAQIAARLAYSSTLKMEVVCFSEKSVDFWQAIRGYVPQYMYLYYTSYTQLQYTTREIQQQNFDCDILCVWHRKNAWHSRLHRTGIGHLTLEERSQRRKLKAAYNI
jgi:hypothetical protein